MAQSNSGNTENKTVRTFYSSEVQITKSWYDGPQHIPNALTEQPSISWEEQQEQNGTTIYVNPNEQHQNMIGVGTSLEESTVYNLAMMSPDKRKEVLTRLVHPKNGIGTDLIRIAIGTSDFTAQDFYTYNDLPSGQADNQLANFSIQRDIDLHIVETLQQALEINPDIKIMASPWSPPAWMKTNESLIGGQLKEEYVDTLAAYFRKFVEAYMEQGIPIYALTMQNEPLLEIDYPSMHMPADQQRRLSKVLRKELSTYGFETKLWIFDHNFAEAWDYVWPILNDQEARNAVDGIAFHDYSGEPETMGGINDHYPEKTVHLTERSVWDTAGADRIAQYFRQGATSYNAWVTMLDSNINTHQWIGTPGPTLFIQNATDRDDYWNIPTFYMTGNFSKFIDSGAARIGSNYGSTNSVTNVAFLNSDNTITTVVINQTNREQRFTVVSEGEQFTDTLPTKTVATYYWHR